MNMIGIAQLSDFASVVSRGSGRAVLMPTSAREARSCQYVLWP